MILIGQKVFDRSGLEYIVKKPLDSGGFGQVFLVNRDDVQLALKTANADGITASEFQALKNEGILAAGLDHENVIKIHYFHDGTTYTNLPPYLLMDFAEGGSLKNFIESKKKRDELLSIPELTSFILQIMAGLKTINEKLVHRDFHPGNVLFKSGKLKVSDFGLSKIVGSATRSKTFKGIQHVLYKSPESWMMEDNTIYMDMYSAGIVFYELATLRYPYNLPNEQDQLVELMEAHKYATVTPPKSINETLPDNISDVIVRLLKKRPEDRFETWGEAIAMMKAEGGGTGSELDISDLVAKAQATEAAIEQRVCEEAKQQQLEQEQKDQLAHAVASISKDVSQIVDAVNKAVGDMKLIYKPKDDFSFSVSSVVNGLLAFFEFHIAEQVETMQHDHFFDGPRRQVTDYLKLGGKVIKAWGKVYNQHGKGVNVVLVKEDKNDLYGRWKMLKHKDSPLVQGRHHAEPFALDWRELQKRIQMIRAMDVIVTEVTEYSMSDLKFIIEDIL